MDQIPVALLSPELLAQRNYDGLTPIDVARHAGHQSQIPEHLYPRETGILARLGAALGLRKTR